MYAVFIIGPAGSGKTSLATALAERCLVDKRSVQILNLDPAAENLPYRVHGVNLGTNFPHVYAMEPM